MKKILRNSVLITAACLSFLFFVSYLKAEETSIYDDLIESGVSAENADYIANGQEGTLGERAETMLKNGSITPRQYDKIYNKFMSYSSEERQRIKNIYDEGGAGKLYKATRAATHRKLNPDEQGLKDRIQQLRKQGLSRDKIIDQLRKEGVSAEHLKDLGIAEQVPRPKHAKDIRAAESPQSEHKVDRAHEKKQDVKSMPSRPQRIKKRHPRSKSRQAVKHRRNIRKKEGDPRPQPRRNWTWGKGAERGVRDQGAGRGRGGVGQGGLRRRR